MPTLKAEYREANREHLAEYARTWREANKEKLKEQGRRYYQENKERLSETQRAQKLRAQYGITPDDVDRMVEKQGGGCAICEKDLSDKKERRIDHNHETGLVRGILCHHCNTMLGYGIDDPQILESGARYLRSRN